MTNSENSIHQNARLKVSPLYSERLLLLRTVREVSQDLYLPWDGELGSLTQGSHSGGRIHQAERHKPILTFYKHCQK